MSKMIEPGIEPGAGPGNFDVFSYHESSELIQAYVEHRKRFSKHFSVSNWAKKLDLSSSGILVNFVKKRRLPTEELTHKIADSMQLGPEERSYFVTLVACERAEKAGVVALQTLQQKMAAIRFRKGKRTFQNEEIKSILDPAALAVKALLEGQEGPITLESLRARLRISISNAQLEQILSNLLKLNIIEKQTDGSYLVLEDAVASQNDVSSAEVRSYHRKSLEAASHAVEEVPLHERHFTSYVMCVDPERMPEMKKMCEEFRDQLVSRFGVRSGMARGATTEVYQMNLNIFPLTQSVVQEKKGNV